MRAPADSIISWVNPAGLDSLQVFVLADHISDTSKISFRKFTPKVFTPTYEGGKNLNPNELPRIVSNIPFEITEDTANQTFVFKDGEAIPLSFIKENDFSYILDFSKQEDTQYQLKCFPNSFVDIFGNTNDSLSFDFRTGLPNEFANLIISLDHNNANTKIVELLNNKKKLIKKIEISNEKTVSFDMINPGQYLVRIIEDVNKNGKWDSGHYLEKRKPEKVYYYGQEIKLRANWDFEIDMVLD